MTDDAYSPWKALRHLDVLQAAREGRPAHPAHVQLILTNRCQHRCQFCSYRLPDYPCNERFEDRAEIEAGKAMEIVADCAAMGVGAIQFTGGGEPTLHPNFGAVATLARMRKIQYSVVTNGTMIEERGYTDTMARAAWVRVSLDAATPETYSSVRRVVPSQYDRACSAVGAIGRRIRELGTACVLGVGFVVTPQNYREAPLAASLAYELGADNIRLSAQFSSEDERLYDGCYAEAVAACAEAEKQDRPGFRVYNRFGARLEDLRLKRPDYGPCGYQYLTTYIGADLGVYRCCVTAYNRRGFLGSLKNRSFSDLWLSPERVQSMASFDAHDCPRCQFNSINRPLAVAISPDEPMHSAFV